MAINHVMLDVEGIFRDSEKTCEDETMVRSQSPSPMQSSENLCFILNLVISHNQIFLSATFNILI